MRRSVLRVVPSLALSAVLGGCVVVPVQFERGGYALELEGAIEGPIAMTDDAAEAVAQTNQQLARGCSGDDCDQTQQHLLGCVERDESNEACWSGLASSYLAAQGEELGGHARPTAVLLIRPRSVPQLQRYPWVDYPTPLAAHPSRMPNGTE